MTTIQARVLNVLSEQLGFAVAEIKPEHELCGALNCDSLGCVEVMMGLESEFEIEIDDDKFSALVTVRDVVDYISVVINIDSRADRSEMCDAITAYHAQHPSAAIHIDNRADHAEAQRMVGETVSSRNIQLFHFDAKDRSFMVPLVQLTEPSTPLTNEQAMETLRRLLANYQKSYGLYHGGYFFGQLNAYLTARIISLEQYLELYNMKPAEGALSAAPVAQPAEPAAAHGCCDEP